MRPLLVCLTALVLTTPLPAQDASRLADDMAAAMENRQWDQVATTARKLLELRPNDPDAWFNLGYALHAKGQLKEALEAHVKASELPGVAPVAAYNAACAHALLGHPDEAFQWLDTSIAKGFDQVQQVKSDPDLASLRSDPRFSEVVARLSGRSRAPTGAPNVRVFASTTDRKNTRLFYWNGTRSPAQVAIDFGPIEWKDEYAAMVESDQLQKKRWRLGGNFWTTLDSNVDLTVGGVSVPAGMYYVTLEQVEPMSFVLHLNDPSGIRAKTLDAFQAEETTGGIEVPLTHESVEEVESTLAITLSTRPGSDPRDARVEIAFGPHRLTAPLRVKLN